MATVIDPEELMQEAKTSFDSGDMDSGVNSYRQAASLYADHGNYQLAGFALAKLALSLSPNNDSLDEALAAYKGAAQAFRRAGQPRQSADALFSAGILAKNGSRSSLATKFFLEVAAEYERLSTDDSSVAAQNEALELRALAEEAQRCVTNITAGKDTESRSIRP